MLSGGTASGETLAGTVLAVSGPCTAHNLPLKPGDGVHVRDTVNVPSGGNIKLRMADRSVILVAPGSSMTVASYNVRGAVRHAQLSLSQGLLRLLVTPVAGPSTFEVSTAAGTASVRSGSADWFIAAQNGSAQVGVLAGTVEVASAVTRRSVSISTHRGTRLEVGHDPALPRTWAQVEFDAFIRRTECCQSALPKP